MLWIGAGLVAIWLLSDTVRRYAPQRRDPLEIRLSYWGSYTDNRLWQEIISAFERSCPEIRIRPEWLPLAGYTTKIDQQFMAGDAPDLILFQDEPFPRYAGEQFADLSPLLAEDVEMQRRLADCWPTAIASFKHGEALRGLPISGGNVLIYCNLDAFERAAAFRGRRIAPPRADWTLQEFMALCQELTIDTDGDGEPEQFGCFQPHWGYFMPFIWAHGARLLDESRTRWAFQGSQALDAVSFYADLHHRYGVTPSPIQYAGHYSDTAFLSGRVAMYVNGPWFEPFLKQTRLADRYRVVDIPTGPGGNATRVTWDGLCLYAKSPPVRRVNAWRFARFLLSRQAQNVFAIHHRAIPARRACAERYVVEGGGPGSGSAAFLRAMDRSRLQPITPNWQVMYRAVQRHFNSVLLDGPSHKSPAEALEALAAEPDIVAAFGRSP